MAAPIAVRIDSDHESECDLDFHDIEVEYLDFPLQCGGTALSSNDPCPPLQGDGGVAPIPSGGSEQEMLPGHIDPFDDPFLEWDALEHHPDEDAAFT